MQVVTEQLLGDGFAQQVTSHRAQGWVVVTAFGRIIAQWPEADSIACDVFIAAALQVGWQGKTVAALSFTSPASVSRVRSRLADGGLHALLHPERPGRKRTITAAQLKRAKTLRRKGLSFIQIADELGVAKANVARVLKGVAAGEPVEADPQQAHPALLAQPAPAPAPPTAPLPTEPPPTVVEDAVAALESPRAGDSIPADGAPRACRYAGVVLVAAALGALGLQEVLTRASVQRPGTSVYTASTIVHVLCGAWAVGHPSIESMHEQDPFALGMILGLARAPSVRTLHRALRQMTAVVDPIQLWAASMTALMGARSPEIPVFGIDGHFKPYFGDAPIDKGWSAKRRIVEKGLATVRVNDLAGHTFSEVMVPSGDSLHAHVMTVARALREAQACVEAGDERPTVLAFDRGGFSFHVLNALAAECFWYLVWIPSSVRLDHLDAIAPTEDGVAEGSWTHASLEHPARLLVTRDGDALVPAATNLPTWVDAATAMELLRGARGMQENAIKSARAFAHIDRLSDRGASSVRPDDRAVNNPEHLRLRALRETLRARHNELEAEKDLRERRPLREITLDLMVNELHSAVVASQLAETPREVPRHAVDAEAMRAELKVRNRQLVLPLKNHLENGRRWLAAALGAGLSPTDHEWDQDTRFRTLTALLRAPGTLRFYADRVEVELTLPLAPTAHDRLRRALERLDEQGLRFLDGRAVRFRLAPRPTRGPEISSRET